MTDHIPDGWLWLSNGSDYLKLFCEHIFWIPMYMPDIEHHEGGVNIGFDLSKFWVVIKASGVWLNTNTKYENFSSYLKTWQQANILQVEIIRDGSNNKVKLDGTNTVYPVLVVGGLKELEKMPGDQQKYRLGNLTLEQNGTAS